MNRLRLITAAASARNLPALTLALGLALCSVLGAAHAHERRDGLSISGTPPGSVTAGQNYSFTPSTYDPRLRPLAYAIANKPAWATFSSSSGQLSGTPPVASVGTYPNIVIAVSDGWRTASLAPFSVQVLAGITATAPPVISGTPPASDVAGSAYVFQPTASDPAGRLLAFSVQNKPVWATFSIVNGLLSGTPSGAQTGTYTNILISASDGQQSSALPAFSITVTGVPATTGSAVLQLTAPTQNTDGSALTDLAGFRIYYGNSPSSLTQLAQLPGTALMSYTASNLSSGTWYFAATAYTTVGTVSAMSTPVSKTIP